MRFPFSSVEANKNWLFCVSRCGRPRAVVPVALRQGRLRARPTEGALVVAVPRLGTRRALGTTGGRAVPWQGPTAGRPAVRLQTDRAPYLSDNEPEAVARGDRSAPVNGGRSE